MKKLNERQRRFVDEFLITGNASESAKRAGYDKRNADVTAARLMKNPEIKTQIERRLDELHTQRTASIEEILHFMTATLRGEVTEKFCVAVGNGASAKVEVLELPAKVRDRLKAAEFLAKIHGLFRETKEENEVPDTIIIKRYQPDKT